MMLIKAGCSLLKSEATDYFTNFRLILKTLCLSVSVTQKGTDTLQKSEESGVFDRKQFMPFKKQTLPC
jgi:hypothetical protein